MEFPCHSTWAMPFPLHLLLLSIYWWFSFYFFKFQFQFTSLVSELNSWYSIVTVYFEMESSIVTQTHMSKYRIHHTLPLLFSPSLITLTHSHPQKWNVYILFLHYLHPVFYGIGIHPQRRLRQKCVSFVTSYSIF